MKNGTPVFTSYRGTKAPSMIFMDMRIFENRNNGSFSVWKHPTLRISPKSLRLKPHFVLSESQLCSFVGRIPQFLVRIPMFVGYINCRLYHDYHGIRSTSWIPDWPDPYQIYMKLLSRYRLIWVDGHGPPRFFRVLVMAMWKVGVSIPLCGLITNELPSGYLT